MQDKNNMTRYALQWKKSLRNFLLPHSKDIVSP